MHFLDYLAVVAFFGLMVLIGIYSYKKVDNSDDYFTAGGQVPWWLAGISHHVSGYSGAVFVGYAVICYNFGFTMYVWWAIPITIACIVGAFLIAPKWSRLRERLNIQSPTEYLSLRYNIPTQQVMAWSGTILKLFDVAAKWTAMGVLLNGFAGIPVSVGILVSGGVSLLYITIGGLWADLLTDFAQFIIQILGGLFVFFGALKHLGGISSITGIWKQLPPQNSQPFNGPYTMGFALAYVFITFLSYNGGTWNLATRYISAPSGSSAKKSALLSAALYLIWPLFLFFPMWAGPILFPGLKDPSGLYSLLTKQFLPAGMVGFVLASMFANTMSMTTSDANVISSVIVRDILPVINPKIKNASEKQSLKYARWATLIFTGATLILSLNSDLFGGVLGLIITWFGGLVGPTAIPMLLGLLPAFKHCDSKAALVSIFAGFGGFALVNFVLTTSQATKVATPVLISLAVFIIMGLLNSNKAVKPEIEELLIYLNDEKTNIDIKA